MKKSFYLFLIFLPFLSTGQSFEKFELNFRNSAIYGSYENLYLFKHLDNNGFEYYKYQNKEWIKQLSDTTNIEDGYKQFRPIVIGGKLTLKVSSTSASTNYNTINSYYSNINGEWEKLGQNLPFEKHNNLDIIKIKDDYFLADQNAIYNLKNNNWIKLIDLPKSINLVKFYNNNDQLCFTANIKGQPVFYLWNGNELVKQKIKLKNEDDSKFAGIQNSNNEITHFIINNYKGMSSSYNQRVIIYELNNGKLSKPIFPDFAEPMHTGRFIKYDGKKYFIYQNRKTSELKIAKYDNEKWSELPQSINLKKRSWLSLHPTNNNSIIITCTHTTGGGNESYLIKF